MMAFEGATKRQKPDLQAGDAVYARLLSAHREMEPELVCVDSFYKVCNGALKTFYSHFSFFSTLGW